MTSRDLFRRLRAALYRPGEPLPEEVRAWLLEACDQYDGSVALDVHLGLRGPGVRTLATLEKIDLRNLHLMIARTEFSHGGDPRSTPAERDAIFLRRVTQFRRKWPRIKHHMTPPPVLDPLDQHLFHAFRAGDPPTHPRVLLAASEPPRIHV